MNKPFTPARNTARKLTPRAEFLDAETELRLARAWRDSGDVAARNRLVTSHRALAASVARRAMGQAGVNDADLLQHAYIGLLKAADRFDPDLGNRFSTYAAWWVRAEVQDYRLTNWSLVRRGNSARLRKAFFNLGRIEAALEQDPTVEEADMDRRIAAELGVNASEVDGLRARFRGRDSSLNVPSMGEDGNEIMDLLEDPDADVEGKVSLRLDRHDFLEKVAGYLTQIPDRERDIVIATHLDDPPKTLADLGEIHGISRERVRQLRERGLTRLREAVAKDYPLESRPF